MGAHSIQHRWPGAVGFFGGKLTIDPYDLTLDSAYVQRIDPRQICGGLYQINLQADHNITLSTAWTLNDSDLGRDLDPDRGQ